MRKAAAGLIVFLLVLSMVATAGLLSGADVANHLTHLSGTRVRPSDLAVSDSPLATTVSHDLNVSASNVTTLAGMKVSFTATVSGVTLTLIEWWWGDGTTSAVESNPGNHAYVNPGVYLVYAEGTDSSGGIHDNLGSLLRFAVLDSYENDALGNQTQVQGSVLANDTSTAGAQAALAPGGWMQVSNWVTNSPNNPQWTLQSPSYLLGPSASGYANISTILATGLNLSGATVSWSNTTPQGSYTLNFSVPAVNSYVSPSGKSWGNFTFTIFVAAGSSTPSVPVPTSPHNGTLEVYDAIGSPSSSMTLDPALADDSTDGPILQNIYQTLIVYNGSQAGPEPNDFVPDLATCVPGSAQCSSIYGTTLVSGENWTFVINPADSFYNGSTGASWHVYPNDVAFSFARSCLMANGYVDFEDWQLCQTILPENGNASWDNGIHSPWNNTAPLILAGMSLNNSLYCTPQMEDGIHGNGCITFDTVASGKVWPEFLEFVESTASGGGVVSCSWAASEGVGLPGWTNGSKCYPSPPGFPGNPNPAPAIEAWTSYELSNGQFYVPNSALRFHALGSGPYYLVSFDNLTGYSLAANPEWGGTTCQGGTLAGCLPKATVGSGAPSYISNVVVHFEASNGPGLAAIASGGADLIDTAAGSGNAGYGGNGSTILSEVKAGSLSYIVGPAIDTYYATMEPTFNTTAASSELGSAVTLPSDAFQDLNFRQFVVNSYPHLSSERNDCIVGGILYCFSMGGAIPLGMNTYYPTNISWPLANADANPLDVGSAAWWWAQTQSDPLIGAACSTSTPCTFPVPATSPQQATDFYAWVEEIITLSQGAIRPTVVNISWPTEVLLTWAAAPGNASFPISYSWWGPDYFDPSDYADPFYGSAGYISSHYYFPTELTQAPYDAPCPGPAVDPTVSTACQGTAYSELESLVNAGDACLAPSCSAAQRALEYNMAERIELGLGLYVHINQSAAVYGFAPWIDPSSLLQNPDRNNVYGGTTSDQPFFFIRYATDIPQGYELRVYLQTPGGSTPAIASLSRQVVEISAVPSGSPVLEADETFLTLVSVVGGTGVYHYLWNGLPAGCTSSSTAVLACRPSQGGNISMSVTVIDSAGATGTSNALAFSVAPRINITSFVASPTRIDLGASVSFAVTTQGGIGAPAYAYVGLPPGCAASRLASFACIPSQTGQYTVTASVSDSIGIVSIASVQVDVVQLGASSPASFLGLPGDDGYFLIAGLALMVIALAIGVLRGRRSRRPSTGTAFGTESVGPSPSGSGGAGGETAAPQPAESVSPSTLNAATGGTGAFPTPPPSGGSVACPSCGARNRAGAKYCDQCGSSAVR